MTLLKALLRWFQREKEVAAVLNYYTNDHEQQRHLKPLVKTYLEK